MANKEKISNKIAEILKKQYINNLSNKEADTKKGKLGFIQTEKEEQK